MAQNEHIVCQATLFLICTYPVRLVWS